MAPSRRSVAVFAVAALLLIPASAQAALMLSLQAEGGPDLNNLTVGQSLTIDVILTGLQSGDQLGYLAGTATFSSSLLGTAANVTPGSIVPTPADFLGVGAPGIADGSYDYFFSNLPIVANGTFFSFKVTVQGPGSGTIAFNPDFLAARDLADEPVVLTTGQALVVTARAPTAAVPEPSGLVIFGLGTLFYTGLSGWRRRRLRCLDIAH